MRLFKYLSICFFISAISGANSLKMEEGDRFCSSAAPLVYLECSEATELQKGSSSAHERKLNICLRNDSPSKPVGYIKLCFSVDERLVMLDRLEINEDQRKKGYGTAAIIVAFKICTNRLPNQFDSFRVAVEKNNMAAVNLYSKLGFKPTLDTTLVEQLKDAARILGMEPYEILDFAVNDFLQKYPKPAPAIEPDAALEDK